MVWPSLTSQRSAGLMAAIGLKLLREVVTFEQEALTQVKTMGGMAGVAGIKMNLLAIESSGAMDQRIEQGARKAFGGLTGERGQVIDVQHPPPGKKLSEPKAGSAFDHALVTQGKNLIGLRLLAADLSEKVLLQHMRPQHAENWKAGLDLCVRVGDEGFGVHKVVIGDIRRHGAHAATDIVSRSQVDTLIVATLMTS